MTICSAWDHSLKKKPGRCPVAWEMACQVWASWRFLGHSTSMWWLASPSHTTGDVVKAASTFVACKWERGAMWVGTRLVSGCQWEAPFCPQALPGNVWRTSTVAPASSLVVEAQAVIFQHSLSFHTHALCLLQEDFPWDQLFQKKHLFPAT